VHLSSEVTELPLSILVTFTFFVVRLDNAIGDAGVKHLANMLKVNKTLTILGLRRELCFICIVAIVFPVHVSVVLNNCVCCYIGNQIGDAGIRDIAEVLKVNSTLVSVGLTGRNICSGVFHSPLTYSCPEIVISKVAASYIIDALKVNATFTSICLSGECFLK